MLREESSRAQTNGAVSHPDEAQALVTQLVANASRPLAEAEGLPGAVYTSQALYDLEVEKIWRKEWIYVGRAEELAKPGDFLTVDIVGEPVVVIRGKDDEIRALSRICRHRFADLLSDEPSERGHVEGFVCPYHSWAFTTEGKFSSAPFMKGSTLFERERDSYCLPEFGVQVWQGYLFVNLDRSAPPMGSWLSDVETVLDGYRLEEWHLVDRLEWPELPTNWKLVMENGRECYHHQGTHKNTLEPLWPTSLVVTETTDSRDWYYQRMMTSPEAASEQVDGHNMSPVVLAPPDDLSPFQRSHYLLFGKYPNVMISVGPDLNVIFRILPTGPASHRLEISLLVHESRRDDPGLAVALDTARSWLTEIQNEDAGQLEAVQRSLNSKHLDRGGALSPKERPIWQFHRYLAHRLAGADV